MAKKIFVSKSRLVKGSRWYIDYTRLDVETGTETRHRQDFDLNDIEDLTVREAVAARLIQNLDTFIQYDKPEAKGEEAPAISVKKAVEFALFRDFDLGRGVVTVSVSAAKEYKKSFKTIPKAILHYFRDGWFDQYPANWYMFGLKKLSAFRSLVEPSNTPVRDDRMYKRHVKVLEHLRETGQLRDIKGLTWYSWKDTGISLHAHKTTPLATRDQAGHSDFDMTLVYYHADEVNSEYANLPNDLF